MATKRYQIWDKTSNVYTPSGERFTPEMWIDRYPIFEEEWAIPVISTGTFNGGYCGELNHMKDMYANNGVVFTKTIVKENGDEETVDMTPEECLEAIEAFIDEMSKPVEPDEVDAQTRIADALEYQNMMAE